MAGLARRAFVHLGVLAAGFALARDARSEDPLVTSVDGPLVSTRDMGEQRALFEGVFGLEPVAEERLDESTVRALWGVAGHSARTVLLHTPGTRIGVRLVAFEPTPAIAIREGTKGYDSDALKVIDFTLDHWDEALALLRAKGFDLSGPPAEYALPGEGRFTEGHVKGPDGVLCAFVKFHDSPRTRFVRITGRLFSEILGVSAPVANLPAVKAFHGALGLGIVYRYEIESASFQHLVGMGTKTRVTGTNFGLTEGARMIGIIHYGLPPSTYRSLKDRSVLPNRGLVALRLTTRSAAAVEKACARGGYQVLAPVATTTLKPHGRVRSLSVRAPHGVVHHFLEPS